MIKVLKRVCFRLRLISDHVSSVCACVCVCVCVVFHTAFRLSVISDHAHSANCSFVSTGWATEALVLPIKAHDVRSTQRTGNGLFKTCMDSQLSSSRPSVEAQEQAQSCCQERA